MMWIFISGICLVSILKKSCSEKLGNYTKSVGRQFANSSHCFLFLHLLVFFFSIYFLIYFFLLLLICPRCLRLVNYGGWILWMHSQSQSQLSCNRFLSMTELLLMMSSTSSHFSLENLTLSIPTWSSVNLIFISWPGPGSNTLCFILLLPR